jgi:spermidine synthase
MRVTRRHAVAACFFLSGAAGLLQEVAWLRLLTTTFGHTVYATTTVLAAYMGGLALGSLLLGRWADRVRRPILAYAILEAAIAGWCLATPVLFRLIDVAYVAFFTRAAPSALEAGLVQLLLSTAVMLPPTILMGATLPLLGRSLAKGNDAGRTVGALYAWNTWGAVVGATAAGMALLPRIGVRATIGAGAAIDLAVAGAALLLSWRWLEGTPASAAAEPRVAPPAPLPDAPPGSAALVLALAAVSGVTSMAYEISWTRALSLAVGSSTYAFTAMLAAFLTGLALGAHLVSRLLRRRRAGLPALGRVQIGLGLSALLLLPAYGKVPVLALALLGAFGLSAGALITVQFVVSVALMIVPTTLLGATLPLAVAILVREGEAVGRDVGRVFGINTIGTVVGSVAAGFAAVPLLGIQGTVAAAACVNVLSGGAVLVVAERRRGLIFAAASASALLLAGLVATGARWDRAMMSTGPAVYAREYLDVGDPAAALRQVSRARTIPFYREGINTTVAVVRMGKRLGIAVNGKIDASNGKDMVTQLMLGHLPAFTVPQARRALVIGLGSGVTVGALALHPVQEIDVAELEPEMLPASEFFVAENRDALRNPKVRIRIGDGRHVLAVAPAPYDIIVSEPSNPWIAGVASLFTREFYAASRARLTQGGVLVQWLQGYSIRDQEMRMVVRTLSEVFPSVEVWSAAPGDYVLVASNAPVSLDLPLVASRAAESRGIRDDLALFAPDPQALLSRFVLGAEDIGRYAAGAPLNTDDLPLLEFNAPLGAFLETVDRNHRHLLAARRREVPHVTGLDRIAAGSGWGLVAPR